MFTLVGDKFDMCLEFKPSSSRLSAVFALDGSREIQDFRSARGNIRDPVQGCNACTDSVTDAVQKLCSYAF